MSSGRANCSDTVRASCAATCLATKHAHINMTEIRRVAKEWREKDELRTMTADFAGRLASPLTFDTIDEEINFSFLSDMLQFGSGFREELTKHGKRGASDTMLYGMLGLHMQFGNLTADRLSILTRPEIATIFGIPLDEEYEMQPGIRSIRPSPLAPLVNAIWATIQQAVSNLRSRMLPDFAAFVRTTLTKKPSAQYLISEIVSTFPNVFADVAKLSIPPPTTNSGSEVQVSSESQQAESQTQSGSQDNKPKQQNVQYECHILKKAQLVVSNLYYRFFEREPQLFAFTDWGSAPLTIFADNVIPTVLCSMGIISLSPRILKAINDGEDMSYNVACHLRAAAVTASELLLNELNAPVSDVSESKSEAADETKTEGASEEKTTDEEKRADATEKPSAQDGSSAEDQPAEEIKKGSRPLQNVVPFTTKYTNEEIDLITKLMETPSPSRSTFSAPELDHALWRLGKSNRQYRETKRLSCKNTVFF